MRLRVLSYNVHKCVGGVDRRYDPQRIADTIAHYAPDFACLQEVLRRAPRYGGDSQVDRLGDLLGYRHRTYFTNVLKPRGQGEYGNAILSRFPITETRNINITVPPKKRRSVLHARFRVRTPSGRTRTVHVFNMHLGLSGLERRLQLRRFLESHPFAGLDPRTPVLVAGDFNDLWGTLGRRHLVPAGFRGVIVPIRTFPAWAPMRALDAVFVRGDLRLEHVYGSRLELARHASDHIPLIAEVELTNV